MTSQVTLLEAAKEVFLHEYTEQRFRLKKSQPVALAYGYAAVDNAKAELLEKFNPYHDAHGRFAFSECT